MSNFCPLCGQRFDENAGFCPFDGTPLLSRSGRPSSDAISLRHAPSTTAALSALDAVMDPLGEYRSLIGQTLDERYTIEQTLGEGGAGVVFLARHALIDKPVAVKILKREAASDPNIVHRFEREARAAARIGHESIVDITHFGRTPEGLVYLVMEYIEGPTLDQVLATDAPMDPVRALGIALQIAHALGAAHEKGIVHRDLKPENVFILARDDDREAIKLVDFGIAKVTELDGRRGPKLTVAGTVFGTPEYMSPEQAAGLPDVDHRADIYSLGALIYKMVSDSLPHDGGETMRTLAMKMLDPAKPLSQARPDLDIPDELETLVMRALTRKPDQRYQSMDEFTTAMEACRMAITTDTATTLLYVSSSSAEPTVESEPVESDADGRTPPTVPEAPGAPSMEMGSGPVPTLHQSASDDSQAADAAHHASGPHENEAASRGATAAVLDTPRATPAQRRWPVIAFLSAALVASAALGFALTRGSGDTERGATTPGTDTQAAAIVPVTPATEATSATGASSGRADTGLDRATRADAGPDASLMRDDRAGTRQRHGRNARDRSDDDQAKRDRTDPKNHRDPSDPSAEDSEEPTPTKKDKLAIQILTVPDTARLYVNENYSGPGGTTIERARGTELTVECRQDGYRAGRVRLRFDGEKNVVLCEPKRLPDCDPELKNPFNDACENP